MLLFLTSELRVLHVDLQHQHCNHAFVLVWFELKESEENIS